jgi:hypothetical protein
MACCLLWSVQTGYDAGRNKTKMTHEIKTLVAVGLFAFGLQQVSATEIVTDHEIQINGFTMAFDGTTLYDSSNINTGLLNSSPLAANASVNFLTYVDGALVSNLSQQNAGATHLSVDLKLTPFGSILNNTISVLNDGGTLNFEENNAFGLRLDSLTSGQLLVSKSIKLTSIGGASVLGAQTLPFGFAFDPLAPITYSFTSSAANVVLGTGVYANKVKSFTSLGVLTISQEVITNVPEGGSTIMLFGVGTLGLAALSRRQASAAA